MLGTVDSCTADVARSSPVDGTCGVFGGVPDKLVMEEVSCVASDSTAVVDDADAVKVGVDGDSVKLVTLVRLVDVVDIIGVGDGCVVQRPRASHPHFSPLT